MSDSDVKELWEAISGMRSSQQDILVSLTEIKAGLRERCEHHRTAIERLSHRQDGLDTRIGAVEDGQTKLFVYAGMVGAAVVGILKWGLSLLAKAF